MTGPEGEVNGEQPLYRVVELPARLVVREDLRWYRAEERRGLLAHVEVTVRVKKTWHPHHDPHVAGGAVKC